MVELVVCVLSLTQCQPVADSTGGCFHRLLAVTLTSKPAAYIYAARLDLCPARSGLIESRALSPRHSAEDWL